MIIKVRNCHECPFANNDNEFGHDYCNLGCIQAVHELPKDRRHKDCPLEKESCKVIAETITIS